jgi:acetyl-CoA carboxylase carboxyltransferase component
MGITVDVRWDKIEKQSLLGGGQEAIQRQQALGKFTARQRLDLLLDEHSFIETDRLATSPLLSTPAYTDVSSPVWNNTWTQCRCLCTRLHH